jgi:hypothetical protein
MRLKFLPTCFIIAMVVFASSVAIGQPHSILVDSKTLFEFGYNSSGTATSTEDIDLVTVGSTTVYYYPPDPALNPGYLPDLLHAAPTSSFHWTVTNSSGPTALVPLTIVTNFDNYKSIKWVVSTGDYFVNVYEQSASPNSCPGTTITKQVTVIAAPTVTFPVAGGSNSTCVTGLDGSLTVSAPALNVNFTSAVAAPRQMTLQYDLTGPTGFSNVTNQEVSITETTFAAGSGTGTFSVIQNLNKFGIYTITLKNAGDRIANKGSDYRNPAGITNATYTFIVSPTPNTGTLMHVTNE